MKFYDHAKNCVSADEGCAVAKARREAFSDCKAYTVYANWKNEEPFFWDGCYHDVLQLAKSLYHNRAERVRMYNYIGEKIDFVKARY